MATINGMPSMEVAALSSGADINGDLPGVQVAVRVDTKGVDDGTTLQLEVQHADGSSTSTEAAVSEGQASFPAVDLGTRDGAVTLLPVLSSESDCAISSHAVVVQTIRCAITSPLQDETLTRADDLVAATADVLETTVRVATNAPDGSTAALSVADVPSGTATVQGFTALFDQAALYDMNGVALDAVVTTADGSQATCSAVVDVDLGFVACTLDVPAASVVGALGQVVNEADDTDAGLGLQTDVVVSTDAADGAMVDLILDDGVLSTAPPVGGSATFVSQSLPEGRHALRALCHDAAGNQLLSLPYPLTVDSIPPATVDDPSCDVLDRRLASLRCTWTAPAESGTGLAGYDLRYLRGGGDLSAANFASAPVAVPPVAPVPPGAAQTYVLSADAGNAIRLGSAVDVALVALDAAGNSSALSADIAPVTPTLLETTLGAEDGTAYFGLSVASGDFNCDGFGDLAVGAPDIEDASPGPGRVYLYFGGVGGLPAYYDSRIVAAPSAGSFGNALTTLGNFDGDTQGAASGCDDLAVGANLDARIFVYLGRPAWFDRTDADVGTGAEVVVEGENAGWSGRIAGGDLNGDGQGDLLYGVHDVLGIPPKPLRVQALFGRNVVPMAPGGAPAILSAVDDADVSIDANDYSSFGGYLSAADVNGDGFDDALIGHYEYDVTPNDNVGAAYVVYGGLSLPPTLDVSVPSATFSRIVGGPNNLDFGAAVNGAGDLDGDGAAELVVGDQRFSSPAANAGIAYVFAGLEGGVDQTVDDAVWIIANGTGLAASNDYLGRAFVEAGERLGDAAFDVDRDGFSDLTVAETAHGAEVGSVLLYFGGPAGPAGDSSTQADLRLVPPLGASGSFGTALVSSGQPDFNGDGFADIAVSDATFGTCPGVNPCGTLTVYW